MLTKGEDFDRVTGLLDRAGTPLEIAPQPRRAYYFYRLKDDRPVAFCVANACGPQSVETLKPDGSHQKWESRWVGDLLEFYPPCDTEIDHVTACGIFWAYDKRLQVGEAMPREELERRAMNMRKSIIVPGCDA